MAAPFTIGQAADLIDKSIQSIFLKSSNPENTYSKYFNVRSTEDYYEKDSGLSGLGESDFVDENAVIMSDVPVQTYDKVYTQVTHGTLLPITHMQWRFGIKKRNLMRITDELRKAILREKERLTAERLDNGWATSYSHLGQGGSRTLSTTGGDGVAAFSASHTSESGGSNINNIVTDGTTVNMDFDYAGLKAAHRTAGLFVDPRGNPRPASLDTLVVKKNSSNHYKAMEILGALKKGMIAESADNDGAGVGVFSILPLDYLQNSGYWYMFDSSRKTEEEGFQFVQSVDISVDPTNIVYKTKEIQVSATSIYDLGHNDVARAWVGSKGTNAS